MLHLQPKRQIEKQTRETSIAFGDRNRLIVEYFDGEYWISERDVCRYCEDDPYSHYRFAYERYSFGCYAGRYCDECWPQSGYRDAVNDAERFDTMDAGEVIEPWDC